MGKNTNTKENKIDAAYKKQMKAAAKLEKTNHSQSVSKETKLVTSKKVTPSTENSFIHASADDHNKED